MASGISKDKRNGKWSIDKIIIGPDSKRHHVHKRGYESMGEAKADLFRVENSFKDKIGIKRDNDDFNCLFDSWISWKKTKVRYHTSDNIEEASKKYIIPIFSHRMNSDVFSESSLSSFRQMISGLTVTNDRKNLIIRIMREISIFGYENGMISQKLNSIASSMLSSFGDDSVDVKRTKKAWSAEEYKMFISTFEKSDKYRIFFEVYFFLGARCSEMRGLQWSDIDESSDSIHIHQQLQYYRGIRKSIISPTKTAKSNRWIKMSPFIRNELLLLKEAYGDGPFVFFGSKAISKTPIVHQIRKHCAIAGLDPISPHEIRHTVASWLVASCQDMSGLILVQKWLGHSSLKETLDTYSHFLKSSGQAMSDVLSSIQSGDSEYTQSIPKVYPQK